MPSSKRTVYFYRLIMEEEQLSRVAGRLVRHTHTLSSADMLQRFQTVYASMRTLSNGRRAEFVDLANSRAAVEIVSVDGAKVNIRIGRPNSANTVGIRDERTLEIDDVPMGPNQNLELFTYCLVDFETGIVSYVGIQGAPKINAIRALLEEHNGAHSVFVRLSSILTDDTIALLSRKDIIGRVSFTVAIPSDEVLADTVSVQREEFDALRNVKYREATFNVVADRNRNVFGQNTGLSQLVDTLRDRYGDLLKKASVRAKNYDESMQTYDLLECSFTRKVTLGNPRDHCVLTEEDYLEALLRTYIQNRNDLLRYTR